MFYLYRVIKCTYMTFEEVKKDYLEIIQEVGIPNDMTGGFVDSEKKEIVIRNPTKTNAKRYMIDVIYYGFQFGDFWNTEFNGRVSVDNNEIVNKLYLKYIL